MAQKKLAEEVVMLVHGGLETLSTFQSTFLPKSEMIPQNLNPLEQITFILSSSSSCC